MTREDELSNLLAQVGLERGIGAEQLADDLKRMTLPSFIDVQTFRESLVAALERQLRAQVERQIGAIRQRMGVAATTADLPDQAMPPMPIFAAQPAPTPALTPTTPPEIPQSQPASQPAGAPDEPAGPAFSPLGAESPTEVTIYWSPDDKRKQS